MHRWMIAIMCIESTVWLASIWLVFCLYCDLYDALSSLVNKLVRCILWRTEAMTRLIRWGQGVSKFSAADHVRSRGVSESRCVCGSVRVCWACWLSSYCFSVPRYYTYSVLCTICLKKKIQKSEHPRFVLRNILSRKHGVDTITTAHFDQRYNKLVYWLTDWLIDCLNSEAN